MTSMTITVTEDLVSMDRACDDERLIWELWGKKQELLRGKKEYYTKDIQYKGGPHRVRMLFDGRYAPTPTVGGFHTPEIAQTIGEFFGILDRPTESSLESALKASLELMDPVLQPVCRDLLMTYIRIKEEQPPGTILIADPRTNFTDGREVMRNVEAEFESKNNRQLDHVWIFQDNGEKFLFKSTS